MNEHIILADRGATAAQALTQLPLDPTARNYVIAQAAVLMLELADAVRDLAGAAAATRRVA